MSNIIEAHEELERAITVFKKDMERAETVRCKADAATYLYCAIKRIEQRHKVKLTRFGFVHNESEPQKGITVGIEVAKNLLFKIDPKAKASHERIQSEVEKIGKQISEQLDAALKRVCEKLGIDPLNNLEDRRLCRWVQHMGNPYKNSFYVGSVLVLEYEFMSDGSIVIREAQ